MFSLACDARTARALFFLTREDLTKSALSFLTRDAHASRALFLSLGHSLAVSFRAPEALHALSLVKLELHALLFLTRDTHPARTVPFCSHDARAAHLLSLSLSHWSGHSFARVLSLRVAEVLRVLSLAGDARAARSLWLRVAEALRVLPLPHNARAGVPFPLLLVTLALVTLA